MASFLKSLFVQEVEEQASKESVKEVKTEPLKQEPIKPEVKSPLIDAAPTPEFVSILQDKLEKQKTDKFDFLKFKESVTALAELVPDESMRFKTAFATAKTLSIDKKSLETDSQKYFAALENEKQSFQKSIEGLQNDRINKFEVPVKQLQDTLDKKIQEILKLQAEVEELKKQISITVSSNKEEISAISKHEAAF